MAPIHSLTLLPPPTHTELISWIPLICILYPTPMPRESCSFCSFCLRLPLLFLPTKWFRILNYSLIEILINLYNSIFTDHSANSDSCFFQNPITFNHVWNLYPALYWNSLILCFIHSFNKYATSTYCVPEVSKYLSLL